MGSCNKNSIDWKAYKFLNSESWKSRIKALVDLMSCEIRFPVHRQPPFFVVSSHVGKGKVALWGLFYKDSDPTYEGSPLMT